MRFEVGAKEVGGEGDGNDDGGGSGADSKLRPLALPTGCGRWGTSDVARFGAVRSRREVGKGEVGRRATKNVIQHRRAGATLWLALIDVPAPVGAGNRHPLDSGLPGEGGMGGEGSGGVEEEIRNCGRTGAQMCATLSARASLSGPQPEITSNNRTRGRSGVRYRATRARRRRRRRRQRSSHSSERISSR